jgi:hypothetical protein
VRSIALQINSAGLSVRSRFLLQSQHELRCEVGSRLRVEVNNKQRGERNRPVLMLSFENPCLLVRNETETLRFTDITQTKAIFSGQGNNLCEYIRFHFYTLCQIHQN